MNFLRKRKMFASMNLSLWWASVVLAEHSKEISCSMFFEDKTEQ
jgi:hypothetical protein